MLVFNTAKHCEQPLNNWHNCFDTHVLGNEYTAGKLLAMIRGAAPKHVCEYCTVYALACRV